MLCTKINTLVKAHAIIGVCIGQLALVALKEHSLNASGVMQDSASIQNTHPLRNQRNTHNTKRFLGPTSEMEKAKIPFAPITMITSHTQTEQRPVLDAALTCHLHRTEILKIEVSCK